MYSRNKQKDKNPWAGFMSLNVAFGAAPSALIAALYTSISFAVGNAV